MSSIMRRRRGLNSAIGGLPSGDADAHNRHHHRPETSTVIAAQIPRQRVRSILLKRALSSVDAMEEGKVAVTENRGAIPNQKNKMVRPTDRKSTRLNSSH